MARRNGTFGEPFAAKFLLFRGDVEDGRGFTFSSLVPAPPTVMPPRRKGAKESKFERRDREEKEADFRAKGDKWNTLLVKDLPGAWFGLSEESLDWEDESTVRSGVGDDNSMSSQSVMTLDSLKNLKPFMEGLRGILEEFGPVKNLDAVISNRGSGLGGGGRDGDSQVRTALREEQSDERATS